MPTLVIKTNVSRGSDLTIEDLGIVVPGGGGSVTLSELDEIRQTATSRDLVDYAQDNAYGAGDSTLILNDGTTDIAQDYVDEFLTTVIFPTSGPYSILVAGSDGTVPGTLAGITLYKPGTGATNYSTITAALAAAVSGDLVLVGPGIYAESFTIPTGVTVRSKADPLATQITGSLATGPRVTMGIDTRLDGFYITLPTDNTAAVTSSALGLATVVRCQFQGNGASGNGIDNTNLGVVNVDSCVYRTGTCNDFIRQSGGGKTTIVNSYVIGGTITHAAHAVGGTLQYINFSLESNATVTEAIQCGAATLTGNTGQLVGTTGLRITSNSAHVDLQNIRFASSTYHVFVDSGVTGGTCHFTSCELEWDKVQAPGAWFTGADLVLSFQDEKEGDEGFRIVGELNVGIPQRGSEAAFGEGDSYTQEMVVLTTNNTATSTTDGGNITDVSAIAQSPTGSTFSFQGTAANHTILIGSEAQTAVDVVKHFGIKVSQTTAAVEVTKRSFVVEIWTGAAWTAIGMMATESTKFYRYANEVFIRADSSEHIRYGITANSTWVKKTISSKTLYWSRIRITNTLTTAPVFQQFKLSPNRSEINCDGTHTFHGRARFVQTLIGVGNIYAETGGVVNASFAVGSGGLPTGWSHSTLNTVLNGDGDAIYTQFSLLRGIDTSYPLYFRLVYRIDVTGTGNSTMILSILPLEVQGVMEADPAGGITPIARTLANTETVTAKAAQAVTVNVPNTDGTKIQSALFGPYYIQNYYEGDVILLRMEQDTTQGNSDLDIVVLEVAGLKWTHGDITS